MAALGGPNIAENNLLIYLDSVNPRSYTTGSIIKDLRKNSDGNLQYTPTHITGGMEYFTFDGYNKIYVDNNNAIPTSSLSIVTWAYVNQFSTSSISPIVSKWYTSSVEDNNWIIGIYPSASQPLPCVTLQVSGSILNLTGSQVIDVNKFNQFACLIGENDVKLYVNDTLAVNENITSYTLNSSDANIVLGSTTSNEYSGNFVGGISSVALYDTLLSQQDIVNYHRYFYSRYYFNQLPITSSLAYSENVSGSYLRYLIDTPPSESNGVTYVLDEDAEWQPDRPELYKRCLYFGGSDYVEIPSGSDWYLDSNEVGLGGIDSYEVEVWIKVTSSQTGLDTFFGNISAYIDDGVIGITGNLGVDYTEIDNSFDVRDTGWINVRFNFDLVNDTYTTYTRYSQNDSWFLYHQRVYSAYSIGSPKGFYFDGFGARKISNSPLQYLTGGYLKSLKLTVDGSELGEMMFEEGAGLTVYASDATSGSITTSNITASRVEQVDAPLLPNSGDVVGCNEYDEATLPTGITEGTYTNLTTYTGRKDFPLTPKDEPCWRNTGTDDATLSTPISVTNEGATFKIEVLINDLLASGKLMGNSANANRMVGFQGTDVLHMQAGGGEYNVDCGLDLVNRTEPFIVSYQWDVISAASENIVIEVKDIKGNILFSDMGGSFSSRIGFIDTLGSDGSNDYFDGDIVWWKIWKDDVLTHHWEYLGNNSLVIWDRKGGNHATINTSNITLNQGTQNVYSSRLKDGWNDRYGDRVDIDVWKDPTSLTDYGDSDGTYVRTDRELRITTTTGTFYEVRQSNIINTTLFSHTTRYVADILITKHSGDDLCNCHLDFGDWIIIPIDGQGINFETTTRWYIDSQFDVGKTVQFELNATGNENGSFFDVQLYHPTGANHDISFEIIAIYPVLGTGIFENDTVPASINNPTEDVYGNTLTHPSGTYLPSDIKLTSPVFRTLDTALQSNEELYRTTTDANGNVVKKDLRIPISYGKVDKGFPALVINDGDYATINSDVSIENNVLHEFEALINSYTDTGTGTIIGSSTTTNVRPLGLKNTDTLDFRLFNTTYNVITGLNLTNLSNFIVNVQFTLDSDTNVSSITWRVLDANRNTLFIETRTNLTVGSNNKIYNQLFACVGNTFVTFDGTISYVSHKKDGQLVHWWQYTGNNTFLIQDRVKTSLNHGTITTADITANQGTQNVFDPFVNGYYILRNMIPESDTWFQNNAGDFGSTIEIHGFDKSYGYLDKDGKNNAMLLVENDTDDNPRSTWLHRRGNNLPVYVGETYTWSLWMKTSPKFDGLTFTLYFNGGSNLGEEVTLTTEWQRFSITVTSDVEDARIGLIGGGSKIARGSGAEIYTCYPQFEKGELTNYQSTLHTINIGNGDSSLISIDNYDLLPQHPFNGLDTFNNILTTLPEKITLKARNE